MRNWRNFTKMIRDRGFKKGESLNRASATHVAREPRRDHRRRLSEDLHSLNDDTDGVFTRALKEHEVMIYDGHSFYGSLDVLTERANYRRTPTRSSS